MTALPTYNPPRPVFTRCQLPGTVYDVERATVTFDVEISIDCEQRLVIAESGIEADDLDISSELWCVLIALSGSGFDVLTDPVVVHLMIECEVIIDREDQDVTATGPTIKAARVMNGTQDRTLEADDALTVNLLNEPVIWEAVELAAEVKAVS